MIVNSVGVYSKESHLPMVGVFNNSKRNISNISFVGINISEKFKGKIDFDNKFKGGLEEITDKYKRLKNNVTGWFQSRKKKAIEEKEDIEMQGFAKAQEFFIQEQDKVINLYKEQLELLKLNNAKQDKINMLEKLLEREQKIKEKSMQIAKSKSQRMGFDSIAGYDLEKLVLTEEFINKIPREMVGENVTLPNSILFFGPNGNGKTSFAKAFANSAGCEFPPKVKGVGKTQDERQKSFMNALIEAGEKAQEHFEKTKMRTILLVDEIDEYACENSSILAELKGFMQVCSEDYHCTIFATTNNPLKISPAIRNSQRMPIKVFIDPPSKKNAKAVFKHYLNDANCDNSVNYDELAEKITQVQPNSAYNNSQIESICNNCIEEIDSPITQKDLLYRIDTTEPGITNSDLQKYNREKLEIDTSNIKEEG